MSKKGTKSSISLDRIDAGVRHNSYRWHFLPSPSTIWPSEFRLYVQTGDIFSDFQAPNDMPRMEQMRKF